MTNSKETDIRVAEIFGPTIQGEGVLIGLPTVFVRTGGCDYRCSWCDSLHAVDPEYRDQWLAMSTDAVWTKILELSGNTPVTVSLSGGNPAIQPFGDLIRRGRGAGYRFALETQGSVSKDWFAELDVLVLSPKPPSSGMETDWAAFDTCLHKAQGKPETVLKIVVFDETDYAYAKEAAARYPLLPVYLQPGNHTPPPADDDGAAVDQDGLMEKMLWLVDKVTQDRWFEARVLPQLHVLLWGNKRGV
ncbi:7-carboxy-7-deazaguanine synthase QueE [Falsihalocynthiibacter arcticus]|uniref:7-carboxy-7-deazaguanine synthase QueE n=1 Tax=Falsihalocynthiibacter arcticus TaxID=1579316 RepID=UPI0030030E0F